MFVLCGKKQTIVQIMFVFLKKLKIKKFKLFFIGFEHNNDCK